MMNLSLLLVTIACTYQTDLLILQDLDFMTYQVRRTTITTFVHLSLPLIYCIGMSMVEPQIYTVSVHVNTCLNLTSLCGYVVASPHLSICVNFLNLSVSLCLP